LVARRAAPPTSAETLRNTRFDPGLNGFISLFTELLVFPGRRPDRDANARIEGYCAAIVTADIPSAQLRMSRSRPLRGDPAAAIVIRSPTVADGVDMWRLARDSEVLDVNSRYAYLLLARDFTDTSVVARAGDAVVGFVTGYRRPAEPTTLLVWQVAVDAAVRGQGLAALMLDTLFDRVPGIDHLETTVTPSNAASIALFTGFARRRKAPVRMAELFGAELLSAEGAEHEPENGYRIGPIPRSTR
jgi:L-2,4-diaminobutyric acid acetyltransferase